MRVPRLLLLGLFATSGVARADWDVKRAPNDPRIAEALYGALLHAPDDRGALARLTAHVDRAGRAGLATRCDHSESGGSLLACGHLHREAGEPDAALASWARLDDPRAHRAAGQLLDRLGKVDEALAELERGRPGAAPAVLDELLALYGRAHIPAEAERRAAAEALAQALLEKHPDATRQKKIAEALAAVGATRRAGALYGELAAHGDPVTRVPLYFRQAELATQAEAWDDAIAALDHATALLSPGDGRRREALERVVDVERKRDRLPQLAARLAASSAHDAATEELLGRVLDETGDAVGARRHLERAVVLEPRAVSAWRLLVRLATRAGDEDGAIVALRKLSAATGHEARTELELAERLHMRPGGDREALGIAAAVGKRDRDPGTHSALAALYQKWGDLPRALAEAQLLVRLEPHEAEHLVALGELYEQRGDKASAKKTWQRIAPASAPLSARLRLADVLAEHDEAAEALVLLERAGHDHPDDLVVQRRLADVLDRLRRDVEAELIYRRMLESAALRGDATQVRDLGVRWVDLAARRGSLPQALPHLEQLLDGATGPTATELALVVARACVREKQLAAAERFLQTAERRAQPADRGRLLEARAELLTAQGGRGDEALRLLVQAAEGDPARAPLLYGKASQRAAQLYHDDDALRWAEKAVALAPLDADAQERLGTLLEGREPRRALVAYERALELDAGRDRLRLRTAELALRQGDDEGAARRYRELLTRARDEQALEEAAHRAVVVHELTGRLGMLEREVAPRAGAEGRPQLRRLLIEVDRRYVPLLAARASAGDTAARIELERVAQHALGPLLDSIVEGDRDERRAAIQLVGQLGSRGATPLLLGLAAGEAARRGTEPPPIELRVAAAEALVPLVGERELPRVLKLADDPEQRVRLAATVALGVLARTSHDPRLARALEKAVGDPHDRVAAAACLGLTPMMPLGDAKVLLRRATTAHSLAARACALALADRAHAGQPVDVSAADATASSSLARALLERGGTDAPAGLLALLRDPALYETGEGTPVAAIDVDGVVGHREATLVPARDPAALLAAWLHVLDGEGAATALADLLLQRPVVTRLLAAAGDARATLLDAGAARIARIATGAEPTARALALTLASERPSLQPIVLAALGRPADRRTALLALASERAALLSAEAAAAATPLVRATLAAADWRERRAALACLRRQPALAGRLAAAAGELVRDDNGLVADSARSLTTTPRPN